MSELQKLKKNIKELEKNIKELNEKLQELDKISNIEDLQDFIDKRNKIADTVEIKVHPELTSYQLYQQASKVHSDQQKDLENEIEDRNGDGWENARWTETSNVEWRETYWDEGDKR